MIIFFNNKFLLDIDVSIINELVDKISDDDNTCIDVELKEILTILEENNNSNTNYTNYEYILRLLDDDLEHDIFDFTQNIYTRILRSVREQILINNDREILDYIDNILFNEVYINMPTISNLLYDIDYDHNKNNDIIFSSVLSILNNSDIGFFTRHLQNIQLNDNQELLMYHQYFGNYNLSSKTNLSQKIMNNVENLLEEIQTNSLVQLIQNYVDDTNGLTYIKIIASTQNISGNNINILLNEISKLSEKIGDGLNNIIKELIDERRNYVLNLTKLDDTILQNTIEYESELVDNISNSILSFVEETLNEIINNSNDDDFVRTNNDERIFNSERLLGLEDTYRFKTAKDYVEFLLDIINQNLKNIDNENNNLRDSIVSDVENNLEVIDCLTNKDDYIDINRNSVQDYNFYDFEKKIVDITRDNFDYYRNKKREYENMNVSANQNIRELSNRYISLNVPDLVEDKVVNDIEDVNNIEEYEKTNILPIYSGSKLENELFNLFEQRQPKYAWSRFLGFRLIEHISLIIDGEEYDSFDSSSLLLHYNLFNTVEKSRGFNILIGNIPEMYELTNNKIGRELIIEIPFFFSKTSNASLPLVSMIHSEVLVKIKLRNIEDVLFIEDNRNDMITVNNNYKIKLGYLARYVFLTNDERINLSKNRITNLIERSRQKDTKIISRSDFNLKTQRTFITESDDNNFDLVNENNIVRKRIYFEDPTKLLLFRVKACVDDEYDRIVNWNMGGYYDKDTNKYLDIVRNIRIDYNNHVRQNFKQNKFYQIYHNLTRNVNSLNRDEYCYHFSLYPNHNTQPSGTDNLSVIEDVSLVIELNENIVNMIKDSNMKIEMDIMSISYNILISMSGLSGMLFYGVRRR